MEDKKALFQTILLSVVFIFLHIFVVPLGFSILFYLDKNVLVIFVWLMMVVLYYFVVMRERKGDTFYDSNRKRIKCSLLIQLLNKLKRVNYKIEQAGE